MKKAASDASAPKSRRKTSTSTASTSKPPSPRKRKPSADAATPAAGDLAAAAVPADTPRPPFAPAAPAGPAAAPTLTVVAARVDIGFGNHLFLRGSGPGLSWDVGTPMGNAGCDLWTVDLLGATEPICCKFLINDEKWSAGPDYVIEPGAQLEVTPLF